MLFFNIINDEEGIDNSEGEDGVSNGQLTS